MNYIFLDTIQDSLSIYIKAIEPPVPYNPLSVDFGQIEYLPINEGNFTFALDSVSLSNMQFVLPGNTGAMMPFSHWIESVTFLLFMVCFVLFAFIFRNASGTFASYFKTYGHKIQVTTAELWGRLFMIGQTILLATIFLFFYFTGNEAIALPAIAPTAGFISIFTGLGLLAGMKFVMYKIISSFFLTGDLTRWIAHYFRHVQLLGLLLFLPVLIFVFLQEYRDVMFWLILFLFFINRLSIIISLLNIFVENKIAFLYFLVYLCGTEIAPYLLYYKGALSIVNIAGNY